MRIDYYLFDPTGNITILVKTPVPVGDQPAIAADLMRIEPLAEQVGFLSGDDSCSIALRMAGGEFCGNASMCAAVAAAMESGIREGRISVCSSGAQDPVMAEVSLGEDGIWKGTVDMPKPLSCMEPELPEEGRCPVVSFKGISHVIVEKEIPRERAENLARTWCSHLGADALGIMFLDRKAMCLKPLVWVPAAGTLCWENSCASGTTAVGAYLARKTGGPLETIVRQPAGNLKIQVSQSGEYRLTGSVKLLSSGEKDISILRHAIPAGEY